MASKEAARKNSSSSFHPLVAGFTAGVVSTTLLLPLDIIKVRLQVHEERSWRHGATKVLRNIIRHEGFAGLYQGWTPAILGSAISWGGYFYIYEDLKDRLLQYKIARAVLDSPASLNSLDNFVLACTAGGIMVCFTNPIWLIKTRMQLQMKKTELKHNIQPYKNTMHAAVSIVRNEGGIMALYKGVGPAFLLTSHGGVQFVVYEYLRKHFHYSRARRIDQEGHHSTVMERLELSTGYLSMGAVAKIIASTTTYPLQVIKTRMQQRAEALEMAVDGHIRVVHREYRGMIATGFRIWQHEGIVGFFKGCIPNAVRVAPGAAITFVVYESMMDWLSP